MLKVYVTRAGAMVRTLTPMGARLLRQWLLAPLTERIEIEKRLDAVAPFAGRAIGREALRSALDGVRDIERLSSKSASGQANQREMKDLDDWIGYLRNGRD